MKTCIKLALFCAVALATAAVSARGEALTCPHGRTFAGKVTSADSVVVGRLRKTEGRKLHVQVLKVLKAGKAVSATTRGFAVEIGRYVSLGWPGKPGQIALFFLNDRGSWMCDGPIRLR